EYKMTGEICYPDRRFLRRVFPGLRLVGAIRMAFDIRKLMIAALGLALLRLGWAVLDRLFPGSAAITPDTPLAVGPATVDFQSESWPLAALAHAHERLSEPFRNLLSPLLALFNPQSDWATMLHAVVGIAWLLLVWGICGGAICRIAVVRVARMQQTGVGQA